MSSLTLNYCMLLCCSVKNVGQFGPCAETKCYPQAVKSTELHFSPACPRWLNQQMCQRHNFFFGSPFRRLHPKLSQVKHSSSKVWPTQLVKPYFTENTQPGHTRVDFTACWSPSSHSDIHQHISLLLFSLPFPFLLQQPWNIYTGPVSRSQACAALVTLTLSVSLYRSPLFKKDVELSCENRMSDSLLSRHY